MLGVLKTEAAQVAQRSALAALVLGQPGLTSILDHAQAVFLGDRVDGVHVACHAVDVNGQDGPGAFGDPTLDGSGVHRQRGRISVGEHGQGLVRQDHVIRCNERVGGNDHFVTGIYTHCVQGGEQRGRVGEPSAPRGRAGFSRATHPSAPSAVAAPSGRGPGPPHAHRPATCTAQRIDLEYLCNQAGPLPARLTPREATT